MTENFSSSLLSDTDADVAWKKLAKEYHSTHFLEFRTGPFGDKGLTQAMHFQQKATVQDTTVDIVVNRAIKEACKSIAKGTFFSVIEGRYSLRRIAKSLRWLHPEAIKKLHLNRYSDANVVGEPVAKAMRKLVAKALYSVEKSTPELGALIYSVYMEIPQDEPTETEIKQWIGILEAIEDKETLISPPPSEDKKNL